MGRADAPLARSHAVVGAPSGLPLGERERLGRLDCPDSALRVRACACLAASGLRVGGPGRDLLCPACLGRLPRRHFLRAAELSGEQVSVFDGAELGGSGAIGPHASSQQEQWVRS